VEEGADVATVWACTGVKMLREMVPFVLSRVVRFDNAM
jgi:hypothetical protein